VLDLAAIEHARLLVIASPDGFQVPRTLELARERNPRIAIVVRTHSASELEYLIGQGVDRAVMGELELALEIDGLRAAQPRRLRGPLEDGHAMAADAGNLTAEVIGAGSERCRGKKRA